MNINEIKTAPLGVIANERQLYHGCDRWYIRVGIIRGQVKGVQCCILGGVSGAPFCKTISYI